MCFERANRNIARLELMIYTPFIKFHEFEFSKDLYLKAFSSKYLRGDIFG